MGGLWIIRQSLRVCHKLETSYDEQAKRWQGEGSLYTAGFCSGVAAALNLERLYLARIYKAAREEMEAT